MMNLITYVINFLVIGRLLISYCFVFCVLFGVVLLVLASVYCLLSIVVYCTVC